MAYLRPKILIGDVELSTNFVLVSGIDKLFSTRILENLFCAEFCILFWFSSILLCELPYVGFVVTVQSLIVLHDKTSFNRK